MYKSPSGVKPTPFGQLKVASNGVPLWLPWTFCLPTAIVTIPDIISIFRMVWVPESATYIIFWPLSSETMLIWLFQENRQSVRYPLITWVASPSALTLKLPAYTTSSDSGFDTSCTVMQEADPYEVYNWVGSVGSNIILRIKWFSSEVWAPLYLSSLTYSHIMSSSLNRKSCWVPVRA